jgi:hypothetical protein
MEKIKGFKVTILGTSNGKNPTAVELSIKGCKNVTEPTTNIVFTKTTTPRKLKLKNKYSCLRSIKIK